MSWLGALYPWIKALHIVSVIAWMAGLLYLPRLFVYHAHEPAGPPAAETFNTVERWFLRRVMNPVTAGVFGEGWWRRYCRRSTRLQRHSMERGVGRPRADSRPTPIQPASRCGRVPLGIRHEITMNLQELKRKTPAELLTFAEELQIE